MGYNPYSHTFYKEPGDRLGLSLPHKTCRTCQRLYSCHTMLQFHARECDRCRLLRLMPLAFLAYCLRGEL